MAGLLLKIDLFEPDQERTAEWPFSSAIVCDAVDKWVDDAEIMLGETDKKGRAMDNKKVTQFLNVVEKLMKCILYKSGWRPGEARPCTACLVSSHRTT